MTEISAVPAYNPIYSTNITPDTKIGLGTYTFAQFDRTMRKGMAADGHNLYPAMPYPSYAKITPDGLGYLQFCATCHRRDGRGVDNIFPPLAQNDSVQSKDATSVIHIALTGWQSAVTQHSPRSFGMPSYDRLSDTELAEILTFVPGKWGNQGAPVTPAQIAKVRKELKLKAPDAGGPDLQAMVAYIDWMKGATQAGDKVAGGGVAKIGQALLPDPVHGKKVYAEQCAARTSPARSRTGRRAASPRMRATEASPGLPARFASMAC
ncbi:cytochrome c [Janthinobacterium lividum]